MNLTACFDELDKLQNVAEGVHHAAQHTFAYADGGDDIGAANGVAYFNFFIGAHQHYAYVVLLEVHHNTLHMILESYQLARAGLGKSVNTGDTVAHLQYGTGFFQFGVRFKVG